MLSVLGFETFEWDKVGVVGRLVTLTALCVVASVAFLVGEDGFGVVRRVGGLVRTVVTVLRVVVDETTKGFFVVGREVATGIFCGCFVGAAIGCVCVGVACVVTEDAKLVESLLGVVGFDATFVVLVEGRGRLVVTFGTDCVLGGLRFVVGFAVVTVDTVGFTVVTLVIVDTTVVSVVAVTLLELTGVSNVVTSSSCTDWNVCSLILSVVVVGAIIVGALVM